MGDLVIPDLLGAVGGPVLPQTFRQFLENPPVGLGLARRLGDLAHPADPALAVGEGAVVLAPGRGREDDIGKPGGLGGEDILADHEFR